MSDKTNKVPVSITTAERAPVAAGLLLYVSLFVPSAWAAPAPPAPIPCNETTVCKSFELGPGAGTIEDGVTNILTNSTHDGPDWDSLFDSIGETINNAGGTATFIRDDVSGDSKTATPDLTTFTSSGSDKNTDLVQTWNWGTTNVPAKTDITNAYILGVNDASGDLLVYFGAERSAPNGSSYIDIELFQDEVSLDRDPKDEPCPNASCKFEGEHTAGDLLISMNFNNGGALGQVEFRKRTATGYTLLLTLIGEGCNEKEVGLLKVGEACAFNNGATINGGPWPNFDSQANEISSLPKNAFTEWGVNVTNALGGDTPCFPTVQVKTRSSPSFTAELKDFAVRKFQSCNTSVVTEIHQGPKGSEADHKADDLLNTSQPLGAVIHDKAIVTGSDPNNEPTGTVKFELYKSNTCSGEMVRTDTVTLTPLDNGISVAESPTAGPLGAGGYGYLATYSGDGQYPSKVADCEPMTVNTSTSSVNTDIRLNGIGGDSVLDTHVEPETTVVDVAKITGKVDTDPDPNKSNAGPDPTGSVTFVRYASGDCSGPIASMEIVELPIDTDNDGIATAVSATHTTGSSEFVGYRVLYAGDDNHTASESTVCEPICSFPSTTNQNQ